MIKENYVSFEIAKLLKEKGFDWGCYKVYNEEGVVGISTVIEDVPTNYKNREYYFLCPTFQMVMKWLREVHNIIITIHPNSFDVDSVYYKADIWFNREYVSSYDIEEIERKIYEESCEDAIKYCLTNLI